MQKPKKGQIGICKLTGQSGPFVKSHLIPRALTPPRSGGEAFAQIGGRRRPSRRFDSWYDVSLVTQAGENILTRYDTFAIQELRRLKMIWQSWGPMTTLSTTDWSPLPGTPNGIRRISFSDSSKMRLFFYSLLWRAIATNLDHYTDISLRTSDVRRLRSAIRDEKTDLPLSFFPITLTQITTRGPSHNLSPITQIIEPVTVNDFTSKKRKVARFYFDGLAAHIDLSPLSKAVDGLWPMLVGSPEGTTLSMVTWEASWQALNLSYNMQDAEHEFPGARERAERRGKRR